MNEQTGPRRRRTKLFLVFFVFLAPWVAAVLVYFVFPGVISQTRTNKGHLLVPAQPVPAFVMYTHDGEKVASKDVFSQRWTMLYVGSSNCGQTCRNRLHDLRQIHKALFKKAYRVQRVMLVTDKHDWAGLRKLVARQHPQLKVLFSAGHALRQFLDTKVSDAGANGDVYVIDPHGNWVLYYLPDQPAKSILSDMQRLLRLSGIG